ncbi:thioredoxin-like protein [Kalaharituber pfeilii]|nr:thioredoxin-like protein [Kalaharituber pfeilii]
MPSPRRLRHIAIAAVALLVLILWYNSSSRSSAQSQKYLDTLRRLGEKDRERQAQIRMMHSKLREAADQAKERVNERLSNVDFSKERENEEQKVVTVMEEGKGKNEKEKAEEKEVKGEKEGKTKQMVVEKEEDKKEDLMTGETEKKEDLLAGHTEKEGKGKKKDDEATKNPDTSEKTKTKLETEEQKPSVAELDFDATLELTDLLKRAPVIVFSKTTCPYSRFAKQLLTQTYTLTPPPHVVELDLHPHGPALQKFLGQKTGRRTVPNVLVNGRSVGGWDSLEELEGKGELEGILRKWGGKRLGVEKGGKWSEIT